MIMNKIVRWSESSTRNIDPTSPVYKGLTKSERTRLKYLSTQEKEVLSQALFGESLVGALQWEKQRDQRWAALLGETVLASGRSYRVTHTLVTGVPDLVFRERRSGKVLIVELKVSNASLPSDGWLNFGRTLELNDGVPRPKYFSPGKFGPLHPQVCGYAGHTDGARVTPVS